MAYAFDGARHLVTSGQHPLAALGEWTIAFWCRWDSPGSSAQTVLYAGSAATVSWQVRVDPTGFRIIVPGYDYYLVQLAEAYHRAYGGWVVMRRQGSTATGFYDGVRYVQTTLAAGIGSQTGTMWIGQRGDATERLEGVVAEVALWQRALSDADCVELSQGRTPLDYGPTSYLPLRGGGGVERDIVGSMGMLSGTATPALHLHPRVGRSPRATRESRVAYVCHVARGETSEQAWTTDEPDDRLLTLAASIPRTRIQRITGIGAELSRGYYGLEQATPATVVLDPTDRRTVGELIASYRPTMWWRGHEVSGDSDVTRNYVCSAASISYDDTWPHLSERAREAWRGSGASGSYVQVTGGPQPSLTGAWTVLMWVRPLGSQVQKYLLQAGSWAIIYGYVSGQVEFYAASYSGSDPRPNSQIAIPTDAWTMIAYSYDSTTGRWRSWRDGVLQMDVTRSFSLGAGSLPAYIMAAAANLNNFNGSVADVAIIPRELSDADMRELWRASLGRYSGAGRALIGRTVDVYVLDSGGALARVPRMIVTSVAEGRDGTAVTLSDWLTYRAQDPVPADAVWPWRYPLSTQPGAAIPIPYGDAIYALPHIGESRTLDGGTDFALADARPAESSTPDVLAVRDIWWDIAPQQAGLERASSWASLTVVSITASDTIIISGDQRGLVMPGMTLRWMSSTDTMWRYGKVTAVQLSGSDTQVTISGITFSGTTASGVIKAILATPAPNTVAGSPGDIVSIGSGGARVVILRASGGYATEVALVTPGRGYAAGSTYGGVTVLEVGPGCEVSGDAVVLDGADYRAGLTIVRLPAQARGAVMARVQRARASYAQAIHDVLAHSTMGLGIASSDQAASIIAARPSRRIDGALGASLQRQSGQLVLEELLKTTCAALRDLGDRYATWEAERVRRHTLLLGPDAGGYDEASGRPEIGPAPARLRVRFGPLIRARGTSDEPVLDQLDEYPGDLSLQLRDSGPELVVTAPLLMDRQTVDTMAYRIAAHELADRDRLAIRSGWGPELWHLRPHDVVRVADSTGRHSGDWIVRAVQLGDEIEIELAPWHSNMAYVRTGTPLATLQPGVIDLAPAIADAPRATTNRFRNADFSQLRSGGFPLGWWYNGATATLDVNQNYVGDRCITLTATTIASFFDTGTLGDTDAAARLHVARPGWTFLWAAWLSTTQRTSVVVRQMDSAGNIIGSDLQVALRPTAERNGLGWLRYYATARLTAQGVAYVQIWLRIQSGQTVSIDAPALYRVDSRTVGVPPWSR
jgi:hypothetical protein